MNEGSKMPKDKITIDPVNITERLVAHLYRRPLNCKRIDYILEGYCSPLQKQIVLLPY